MRLILFSVLIKMGSHQNGSQEEHQNHHYEKYHKRVRISQNSLLFCANISRSKTLNAIHDSDLTARLLALREQSDRNRESHAVFVHNMLMVVCAVCWMLKSIV